MTRKCDRTGESPFNHYSGSKKKFKQHSTVDENTKKKGYYNKIWPQILWSCRRGLDRVWTEAPSLRLPVSPTCSSLASLQVSASGNKYKWNIPHLTGIFGGPWLFFFLISKHPVCFLNKYNRISLFLYKWNVMHIFPSKKSFMKL